MSAIQGLGFASHPFTMRTSSVSTSTSDLPPSPEHKAQFTFRVQKMCVMYTCFHIYMGCCNNNYVDGDVIKSRQITPLGWNPCLPRQLRIFLKIRTHTVHESTFSSIVLEVSQVDTSLQHSICALRLLFLSLTRHKHAQSWRVSILGEITSICQKSMIISKLTWAGRLLSAEIGGERRNDLERK
jgi:hypothetical protein